MPLFEVLVAAIGIGFSTYWLCTFVTWESGPFRVFEKLRGLTEPNSRLSQLVHCPICQGPYWVAAATLLFMLAYGNRYEGLGLIDGLIDGFMLWLIATGVHVFLARVGVPDMGMFQTMKTYEFERYQMRQDALTKRMLRRDQAKREWAARKQGDSIIDFPMMPKE